MDCFIIFFHAILQPAHKEKQKKKHLEEKLERLEEKIRLSKDKHDLAASSGDLLDLDQVEKEEEALEDPSFLSLLRGCESAFHDEIPTLIWQPSLL